MIFLVVICIISILSPAHSVDSPESVEDPLTTGDDVAKSGLSKFRAKREDFGAKLSNKMHKLQQRVKEKRGGHSKENYFKKNLEDVYDCGQAVEIAEPLCRLQEALQGLKYSSFHC